MATDCSATKSRLLPLKNTLRRIHVKAFIFIFVTDVFVVVPDIYTLLVSTVHLGLKIRNIIILLLDDPTMHLHCKQLGYKQHLTLNLVVIQPLISDFSHSSTTAETAQQLRVFLTSLD
jgi:hypothetical protein